MVIYNLFADRTPSHISSGDCTMPVYTGYRSSVLFAVAVLSGCLQTAPVVVTPQDQAARLWYHCPNGKTLDVTRVQGSASALVVVDGRTLQLSRDPAMTTAERYTNRIQTLTLYGTSASLDSLGQASYGPCSVGAVPAVPGSPATPAEPPEMKRGRQGDAG